MEIETLLRSVDSCGAHHPVTRAQVTAARCHSEAQRAEAIPAYQAEARSSRGGWLRRFAPRNDDIAAAVAVSRSTNSG
jgi:hypothetical protein